MNWPRRPHEAGIDAQYDIFLSHAYCDRERIAETRNRIEVEGYKVYVDWIDDADLERSEADSRTAGRLRHRIRRSSTLFYAVSTSAKISRWMPWELGYADAWLGRIFVLPLDPLTGGYAKTIEFLALYPVIGTSDLGGFLRQNVPKARHELIGPGALAVTAERADRVIEKSPQLLTDPAAAARWQVEFWKAWWAMMGVRL